MWALGGVLLIASSLYMSVMTMELDGVENLRSAKKIKTAVGAEGALEVKKPGWLDIGKMFEQQHSQNVEKDSQKEPTHFERLVAIAENNPELADLMKNFPVFEEWDKDVISLGLLKIMAASPNFGKLSAVKIGAKKDKPDPWEELEREILKQLKITKEEPDPVNTVKVHIASRKLVGEDLNDEAVKNRAIKEIVQKIQADKADADVAIKKISASMGKGQDAVVLDSEPDDFWQIQQRFDSGLPPKIIITYGGYVELRFYLTKYFVEVLCAHYGYEGDGPTKVYLGAPHFQAQDKPRTSYEMLEGVNILDEPSRKKLIDKSEKVEEEVYKQWKAENDLLEARTPVPQLENSWWENPKFAPGVEALAALIDNQDYTAVTALTCPAVLEYLLRGNERRQKKVGIVVASGLFYDIQEDGSAKFSPGFNAARRLAVFNSLMEMEVDMVNLSGGLSKTKGTRLLTDASNGKGEKNYITDPGFKHFDELINIKSPYEMFQILARTSHALTYSKWLDWDIEMEALWKWLGIEGPSHPFGDSMRNILPELLDGELKKVWDAKRKQALENVAKRNPVAAGWNADRLLGTLKLHLFMGHGMQSQVNPADLHSLPLLSQNVPGIDGVVRLLATKADKTRDKKTGELRTALDDIVLTDKGQNFAVTDLDFSYVRNGVQRCLTAHAHMLEGESIDYLFQGADRTKLPPIYSKYLENPQPFNPDSNPAILAHQVDSAHPTAAHDTDMS
ncbi:hypothetical protein CROQUDRAFT_718937 [Cronartium quercuum f. sp. fusiforme G11]|uniref:Uncharacterized protein n=1 Tax=Cronartium quercuum f. sp. fusiforme G11 TaxID=708437 RepID=A0A9P6N5H6_9BASI|nr:hypothetical protein CROQUDRAFT_718937 [Cronartium quercuum f. sp. fusiforme G11]